MGVGRGYVCIFYVDTTKERNTERVKGWVSSFECKKLITTSWVAIVFW